MALNPYVKTSLLAASVACGILICLVAVAYFMQGDQFAKARTEESQRRAQQEAMGSPLPSTLRERSPEPVVVVKTEPKNQEVTAIPEGIKPPDFTMRQEEGEVPVVVQAPPVRQAEVGGGQTGVEGTRTMEPAIPTEALAPRAPTGTRVEETEGGGTAMVVAPGRYLFQNRSDSALEGNPLVGGGSEEADINPETFLPIGEELPVVLMNNVIGNQVEVSVMGQIWHPVFWNGRKILDVGDKVLGQAKPGRNRDRLLVEFSRVVLKDGRTLPIQGQALAIDGTLGIPGYQVGDLVLQSLGPILADFVIGASELVRDQNQQTTNIGGITTTSRTPGTSASLVDMLFAGSGQAMERLRDILLEEIEQEKPYIFIPAGTRSRVLLQQYMDVSQAGYGK